MTSVPGYDRQEPVQVDVAHLLSVLHLPNHLLQLALTRAVTKTPHYGPDLSDINLNIVTHSCIWILTFTNCFVVLVVKHLKGLHHLVVKLCGQDLLAPLVLALGIKGLHGF